MTLLVYQVNLVSLFVLLCLLNGEDRLSKVRESLRDDIESISRKEISPTNKNRLNGEMMKMEPLILYDDVRKGLMPHGYKGDLQRFREAFSFVLESKDNSGVSFKNHTRIVGNGGMTTRKLKAATQTNGKASSPHSYSTTGANAQEDTTLRVKRQYPNTIQPQLDNKGDRSKSFTHKTSIVSPKGGQQYRSESNKRPNNKPAVGVAGRHYQTSKAAFPTQKLNRSGSKSAYPIAKIDADIPGFNLSNAFKICVIGGSMTYGVQKNSIGIMTSAWPALLGEFLNDTTLFKDRYVHVMNAAHPASPSATQANELHDILKRCSTHGSPDMVMVDLTINDRTSHQVLEKGSNIDRLGATDECQRAGGGTMMDLLLDVLPNHIPVWYIETLSIFDWVTTIIDTPGKLGIPCTFKSSVDHTLFPNNVCSTYDVGRGFHWKELLRRGIPTLSYGDIACPACARVAAAKVLRPNQVLAKRNLSRETLYERAYWDAFPHPGPHAHLFVARIIAMSLVAIIEEALLPPIFQDLTATMRESIRIWDNYVETIRNSNDSARFRNDSIASSIRKIKEGIKACALHPLTVLKAKGARPDTFMPRNWNPGLSSWHYEKDYKSNWGWAGNKATNVRSKSINFPVNVSCKHHTVMIQALHSHVYDFGEVACSIGSDHRKETKISDGKNHQREEVFHINTKWHDRTTQLDTSIIKPTRWEHPDCLDSSTSEVIVAAILTCTVISGKVILRGITSC